jgi:imidazolonepropionase-like amidohydrolase
MYDGRAAAAVGRCEVLVDGDRIADVGESVEHPAGASVLDLGDRTLMPGFIDTHVHLTVDGSALNTQTLDSAATKALTGLSRAQWYLQRGFTTLRDLGSMDPEWPTVDLRGAIDAGLVDGPRLVVAGHLLGSTGSHPDIGGMYPSRWHLQPTDPADGVAHVREQVRREAKHGCDWIKTANAGSYFDRKDDPAVCTWFDDEMAAVVDTASLLGMPVAVHTGSAESCKQAIRAGVRSLEHAYLIDDEALGMAERAGVFVVPTMAMNQSDIDKLHGGELPEQAAVKLRRDSEAVLASQRRIAASNVKIAFGTDSGLIPFEQGVQEFQAMAAAGVPPVRALQAATSVAAELLGRDDLGVLEAGRRADLVAMPGDPTTDIGATAEVDFVMSRGSVRRQPR